MHPDQQTLQCSFCNKTQDATAKLISSPSGYPRAYICDQCVLICNRQIEEVPRDRAVGAGTASRQRSAKAPVCSFCHKGRGHVRLVASLGDPPTAHICEECLAVCKSILEDMTAE
jgi:ATP-dependent protease Clp ATPase subunit